MTPVNDWVDTNHLPSSSSSSILAKAPMTHPSGLSNTARSFAMTAASFACPMSAAACAGSTSSALELKARPRSSTAETGDATADVVVVVASLLFLTVFCIVAPCNLLRCGRAAAPFAAPPPPPPPTKFIVLPLQPLNMLRDEQHTPLAVAAIIDAMALTLFSRETV